ncbi:TPA: hypothetical protein NPW24_001894, partial [Klebsiella pneumoniae]|nr:hypothetical protein [Klebsiella pneumoniae]
MSNLQESPVWVDRIYQLTEETPVLGKQKNIPGDGPANIQAMQLANRTSFLKALFEGSLDFKNLTFFITESDPDGTITGLAATTNGQLFRVVQATDSNYAFIYYLNKMGSAEPVAYIPSSRSVEIAGTKIQDLSNELRHSETILSSVAKTSNWTNNTTSSWAFGIQSDGRVFNFIEIWADGISNIDRLKVSIYSRSTDGATVFPGASEDRLLSSKIINIDDVAIRSTIATGYQLIRLVFDDTAVPSDKTALFVVQPFDASGNPVYMG